jgi:dTDP-4-dehydrorhamnose 3,5-epimerase
VKFLETSIAGAFVIEMEPIEDDRGFFARSWCTREFAQRRLDPQLVQCSVSFNRKRGTLRGMHYQDAPHREAKLIRCTMGAVYDVIVDLRVESATFRCWYGADLSAVNRRATYCPEGVAHGFQTLTDNSEVFYQLSEFHHPESARGVRWDDPAFGIEWPPAERVISERDRNYPDFRE